MYTVEVTKKSMIELKSKLLGLGLKNVFFTLIYLLGVSSECIFHFLHFKDQNINIGDNYET